MSVIEHANPVFVLSGASLQAKLQKRWISPKAHDIIASASVWANVRSPRVLIHPDRNFKFRTHYGWHANQIGALLLACLMALTNAPSHPQILGLKSRILFFYWTRALSNRRHDALFGISLQRELLLAAASLRIAAIEIQHGDLAGPKAYWEETHPDYMLVWPTTDVKIFRGSGIVPVAAPFPSAMMQDEVTGERKRIECDGLVFLTHSLGESEDPFGAFPKDLFAKATELQRSGTILHFRIHPVFPKSKLRFLKKFILSKFPRSAVRPRGESITESILAARWCLTSQSSSWLEAALHGRYIQITDQDFWSAISERFQGRTDSFVLSPTSDGIQIATPISSMEIASELSGGLNLDDVLKKLLGYIRRS